MPPALRVRNNTKSTLNVQDSQSHNESTISRDKNVSVNEKTAANLQNRTSNKKKSNKRIKYQKASFDLRAKLVQMVNIEGYSIRQAAKKLALKYSTAKCIYKLFVDESRLGTTHVSKDALLKTDPENDLDSQESSTEFDENEEEPSSKASMPAMTKKVKMEDQQNEVKQEEFVNIKKEFDDFKQSSIQANTSHDVSSEATTPVLQSNATTINSKINLPQMDQRTIGFVPQLHQNFVILLPVQMTGSLNGKTADFDVKSSMFANPQLTQAFNFLNCQLPPTYYLSQNNNAAVPGFMTRFNNGGQLRFGGSGVNNA